MLPERAPYKRMTLTRFISKPFSIRCADPSDLGSLIDLENEDCCDVKYKYSPETIERLLNDSLGSIFVITEINDTITGAIYTQRISNAKILKSCLWETETRVQSQSVKYSSNTSNFCEFK
jgi:hypothetical protein